MNLTSRNQDPIYASLALSSLLSVWYKPNSLNNKSIYNTLLLGFYICAKPRLTNWYQCPKKKCYYFCTGVYNTLTNFFSNTWWWNCGSRNCSETWNAGCTWSTRCTNLTFTPFDTSNVLVFFLSNWNYETSMEMFSVILYSWWTHYLK